MHVCEQGWICNSSICMTRRGMKPTGIAIFEAQQKGFPSVAHSVQVRAHLPSCSPHAPMSSMPAKEARLLDMSQSRLTWAGPGIKCSTSA